MNRLPHHSDISRFRRTVYRYFKKHGRKLPWRRDNDPYRIFVSEVMLQQTQVDRVAEKFETFITALPGFGALARAPLAEVLRLWQGLGYNRRALHLKRAAEAIMRQHRGRLPPLPDELVELPGIGKATAASISAFAFNKPTLFLETNIRSVLIHHFFRDRTSVRDDELIPIARAVLDTRNPRKWYSALMDYGTMLKKRHGNASRRSAQYARQSRFEGSRRQIRGKILKYLLEHRSADAAIISKGLNLKPKLLKSVANELCHDGIISKKGNRYSISK